MARTGLIRARLSRLERDRRWKEVRRIMVTVPRPSYSDSGTECDVHDDCSFTLYGPVEAHFLRTGSPAHHHD